MKAAEPPKSNEVLTGAELSIPRAVWDAIFDRPVDFYPRVVSAEGVAQSLNSDAVLKETGEASTKWAPPQSGTDLDGAMKLARESLTEVSKQTEYQDQKATRLLTVTTFLTAFAGILFTRFLDAYPLSSLTVNWSSAFIGLSYLAFAAFVLMALFGALVVFHATRTRFKYPEHDKISVGEGLPKSLLFYTGIIRARPGAWMNAWANDKEPVCADLRQRYFQNLVSETYLVAAKTADKLRYLQPAQALLAGSLKYLLIWLVLFAATTMMIAPTRAPSEPVQVRLNSSPPTPSPTLPGDAASTAPTLTPKNH